MRKNDNAPPIILCPLCGQSVIWEKQSSYRPFCSKRCQLIDLGEWVNEEKRIPNDIVNPDNKDWGEKEY